MNSLQIGLIAIGVVVVAILFAWQWWQSRKADKKPDVRAHDDLRDAVGATDRVPEVITPVHAEPVPPPIERIEPTLHVPPAETWEPRITLDDATVAAPPAPALPARVPDSTPVVAAPSWVPPVPTAGSLPSESAAVVTTPSAPARPKLQSEWPFDERLHVHASVVSLSGGPFDAAPFVAAAGRASAWVRLFRQSPWELFDPANVGSVQHLALALPLASRAGPIEAHDIDEWRLVLAELAQKQACEAQFFGFRDGPARAAELDSFLAAVDIIPVAYLVKKDGGQWTGTRLRGTLEANGFRLQSDGRFAYHEVETDAVIFHAVDGFERPFTPERLRTESIAALRCMLEPVRLPNPVARFDMFRQSLRALSKLLDAELKTSEGTALGEAEFTAMRDEVRTAMDALANAGIEPGSDTARALFA
ncbi:MAG: hypothetical protein JNL19_12520 [Burkholderiales bacterium]|nr:hypothetical protein [Burkholderiales bacterium]